MHNLPFVAQMYYGSDDITVYPDLAGLLALLWASSDGALGFSGGLGF